MASTNRERLAEVERAILRYEAETGGDTVTRSGRDMALLLAFGYLLDTVRALVDEEECRYRRPG